MKHDELTSILTDLAERAAPSTAIDLWPAIRRHLETGKWQSQAGNVSGLSGHNVLPRRIALVVLALAAAFSLLVSVPQGRVLAQRLWRFFALIQSDSVPAPTSEPLEWIDETPSVPTITPWPESVFAADCGDFQNPVCSVEQIRGKVTFKVKEPAAVPSNLHFLGATGAPNLVVLRYDSPDQSEGLTITAQPWTGSTEQIQWEVGASAVIETVRIGTLSGEYVRGSFVMKAGDETMVWNPSFGQETLRWVEGDTYYTMQHFSWATSMGKDGMAALAENMTDEPVQKPPTPTPDDTDDDWAPANIYNLTVDEAGQQAGFKLALPSHLPTSLSLIGAKYAADQKLVAVFYRLDPALVGDNTNGLVLSQQLATNPAGCALCDIMVGDSREMELDRAHLVVAPEANVLTVQINDVIGKYVEGVWQGTDCCGWEWSNDPYLKTLRWWKDGVAFELSYMGMELSKQDLIAIAESLK